MTFSPPTENDPAPELAAARQPSASNTLGIISLVLGIIAFLTGWVPVLGLILGIGAIVLGALALAKRQNKGFSITGLVLGGVAALISIGATIFVITGVANWNAEFGGPAVETVEPAPSAEPLTAEDLSQFKEVDDATLAQILDDPAPHAEELLIIYGSMGQPLLKEGADGEELCLMSFSPSATEETNTEDDPFEKLAAGIAEGNLYECSMIEDFVTPDAASLSGKKRMWVVVLGTTTPVEGSGGETVQLPVFLVVQTE